MILVRVCRRRKVKRLPAELLRHRRKGADRQVDRQISTAGRQAGREEGRMTDRQTDRQAYNKVVDK